MCLRRSAFSEATGRPWAHPLEALVWAWIFIGSVIGRTAATHFDPSCLKSGLLPRPDFLHSGMDSRLNLASCCNPWTDRPFWTFFAHFCSRQTTISTYFHSSHWIWNYWGPLACRLFAWNRTHRFVKVGDLFVYCSASSFRQHAPGIAHRPCCWVYRSRWHRSATVEAASADQQSFSLNLFSMVLLIYASPIIYKEYIYD